MKTFMTYAWQHAFKVGDCVRWGWEPTHGIVTAVYYERVQVQWADESAHVA